MAINTMKNIYIMVNIKKIIICLLCMIFICNNLWARRPSARPKACHSNVRVIQGAVEMYNMDVATMMHQLDLKILIEEKYLKSEPSKPETSCEYKNVGDLAANGFVICKYHGDVEHLVFSEYFDNNEYEQYEKLPQNATDEDIRLNRDRIWEEREIHSKRVERRKKIKNLITIICIPLAIILFIIVVAPSRKKSN